MTIYFTPGPTQLHPCVPTAMREALENGILSISHRSPEYSAIHKHATDKLRELFSLPSDMHIFFLGSATEAMERIIENTVEKESFHFVNGAFSKRFHDISAQLGRTPKKEEVAPGEGFDLGEVQVPESAELIAITHNETSTGVMLPEQGIHALKDRYPDKLLALDMVSSAPLPEIDFSKIDAAFFSVQKCFGLPAGLGVLFVNEACIHKAQFLSKTQSVGSYHSFASLLKKEQKNQTPETPNVLGIYLLGKVCDAFLEEGLESIRAATARKQAMLYEYCDHHDDYSCFVEQPEFRSYTVAAINVPAGSAPLREALAGEGLVVGSGYKDLKDTQIRVANFPSHTEEAMTALLQQL